MIDMERVGGEIDKLTPDVPEQTGRAAWIAARARQTVAYITQTRRHRVEKFIVNGALDEIPADLADHWPADLPPVTVDTEPDEYSAPIPAGTYRMWMELSYDPDAQDPAMKKLGAWLSDMAYAHGIVPDETQEQRLRKLDSIQEIWTKICPEALTLPLAEALDGDM